MTVNVCALSITFIGSCVTKKMVLQPIQLFWINLIMNSLAALALATEKPHLKLLHSLPQNHDNFILSRKMQKHILG